MYRKLPKNVTKSELYDSLPLIGLLTEHQWNPPDPEKLEMIHTLLKINNISIFTANRELGKVSQILFIYLIYNKKIVLMIKTCDDFILHCRWSGVEFPCFQEHKFLTFKSSTSFLGICCSFNYHPENKDETKYAANTYGVSHGLTVSKLFK